MRGSNDWAGAAFAAALARFPLRTRKISERRTGRRADNGTEPVLAAKSDHDACGPPAVLHRGPERRAVGDTTEVKLASGARVREIGDAFRSHTLRKAEQLCPAIGIRALRAPARRRHVIAGAVGSPKSRRRSTVEPWPKEDASFGVRIGKISKSVLPHALGIDDSLFDRVCIPGVCRKCPRERRRQSDHTQRQRFRPIKVPVPLYHLVSPRERSLPHSKATRDHYGDACAPGVWAFRYADDMVRLVAFRVRCVF